MQPWPGEVLEERAGEIAVGFAALVTRQAAWRHRRVETITVLSHEQVRRTCRWTSRCPAEHRDDVRLSDTEWVVPLALLAKRPLVHFDLRSEDESAVPLLRSDEAQLVARELLYLALDLDREDADDARCRAADRVVLAAAPGECGGGARAPSASSRSSSARCRASRRSPTSWRAASCSARCSTT